MHRPADPAARPPADEDLDRMLSALVDGLLSAEDRIRLEQRLAADPAARSRYLEFMQIEFLLAAEIGFGVVAGDGPRSEGANRGDDGRGSRRKRPGLRGGAAAALLIGAAAWALAGWWRADRAVPPPMARITAVQAAVWGGPRQPGIGDPLAGPLGLLEGTAQVTFASGAVVSIHAPARVEVLGANRLFLRSGRVTPYVPPAAKGFTVVSPSGEVVDFGTEFSIDVGVDGGTDVFVIDGEVAVAGGHGPAVTPLHMTQGFASRFAVGGPDPAVTLRPLVIDHFDSAAGPLVRQDCDTDRPSVVRDGRLLLPIDGRPGRESSMVHTVLGNDFSLLAGRSSVISYKATLPDTGAVHVGRWVALVIDDGAEPLPPAAPSPRARFGIMVSPLWQVGVRIAGQQPLRRASVKVFSRAKDRVGPYQVVVTIDDSPAARAAHGRAVVTAMVNGLEILRDEPFDLPPSPRLSLHTWVRPEEGGLGQALIDDFSVSIGAAAVPASEL
jgi:hypothetical protein